MTTFLYMIVAVNIGVLFVATGVWYGKRIARVEDKLKAAKLCLEASENPFARPMMVPCPCQCGGILQNDGRNKWDTLTFLECTRCKCFYVAGDTVETKEAACQHS